MMIELLRPLRDRPEPGKLLIVKRSLPFVECGGGSYTHRVRSITYHLGLVGLRGRQPHAAVHCWCGQTVLIGGGRTKVRSSHKSALVEVPSRVICATCEGRAIGFGQLGAREIAGRPVMFSPVSRK